MPQVSLYIDEETYQRIEIAAQTEKLSLSKYVATKLRESLDDRWPDRFEELFGSIDDPSFTVPPPAYNDASRETL